jgi:hypothetical protein
MSGIVWTKANSRPWGPSIKMLNLLAAETDTTCVLCLSPLTLLLLCCVCLHNMCVVSVSADTAAAVLCLSPKHV